MCGDEVTRGIRNKAKPWKRKMAATLRRNMTMPERILWSKLKNKQLGVNVSPQSILYGFIGDFYISCCHLLIEVDGPMHAKQVGYDKKRDLILAGRGIRTIRFSAKEVINNTAAVVALIKYAINKRM